MARGVQRHGTRSRVARGEDMKPSGTTLVFSALLAALLLLVGMTIAGVGASPAGAARWAPAAQAKITPGVQMVTDGAQCTGNFVFTDARDRVYVGYAAHCAGKGEASDTNGCETPSYPLGTPVRFEQGGSVLTAGELVGRGRLAYSSWATMRRLNTQNQNACEFNDFALVRVSPEYVSTVNPSVPHWGGPVGLRTSGLNIGDRVYTYGNSGLRGGRTELSPKEGASTGDAGNGWSHYFYTVTPGIPGDSGSGILDPNGRAVGTLSTVGLAPFPAENGAGDMAKELAFAQRHSGIAGLRLVRGTVPFTPGAAG